MSPLAHALSAALIHFVWQGALAGLLQWAALAALRNRSATKRYAVSCAALAVLAALPIITTTVLYARALPMGTHVVPIAASPRALGDLPQTVAPIWIGSHFQRTAWLAQIQIWALPIWSFGVFLFSVRLAFGGAHAFALGRRGQPADERILALVTRLATRMGVDRPVRVLVSTLADGPSVLGWLRPVILLPPASLLGLTPQQLEAVLAHELAHVRRHDYLVNLLQMGVETLLFYHPAVWWTSAQIRRERELCCDDLAVSACGDARCYARALTTLEKLRVTVPSLAMGSTGGPLLYRIQRLLGAREYRTSHWPGLLAMCLALTCVALNVNWLRAQVQKPPATQHSFEVASVKQNKSGDLRVTIRPLAGGRFTATNAPMRALIRYAYQLQDFQLDGGPGWITSDRFDIVAKGEGNSPPEQMRLMLRALLAERFRLDVHTEARELPFYALVLASNDRKNSPKLRRTEADCAHAPAPSGPPYPGPPPCGYIGPGPGAILSAGHAQMAFRGLTMEEFARFLAPAVRRYVVDRTGLTGYFDGDFGPTAELGPPPPPPGLPDPFDRQSFPPMVTMLPEQLGLKLDSQRGPIDVLVIDRVERPTED